MDNRCPACQVGRMQRTTATYVHEFAGTLVQARDMSAWQCDLCGEIYFDGLAVQALETLIGSGNLPPHATATAEPEAAPTADSGLPTGAKPSGPAGPHTE